MKTGWLNPFKKVVKTTSYFELAPIYDWLMSHVDYEAWADYIETIFHKISGKVYRIIDGGCGTGSFALIMKERGYYIVGFDRSYEMVQMARIKGNRAVWQGDLTHLGLKGEWDGFLCLYDTINYLTIEEIQCLMVHLRDILRDKGLFIFDTVTESCIKKYWADYMEKEVCDHWEYIRKSWYNKRNHCQHTEFQILNCREEKIYYEKHVQWIHQLEDLRKTALNYGFKILGQYGDHTFSKGCENSERVHFILSVER